MLVIFIASSRPAATGPEIAGLDKVVHFAIYGLLATALGRAGRGWRAAAGALLAASVYGALDEWHQGFVPARSAELADWLADTAGAAAAVILYTGWSRYRGWLETPIRLRWRQRGGQPARETG